MLVRDVPNRSHHGPHYISSYSGRDRLEYLDRCFATFSSSEITAHAPRYIASTTASSTVSIQSFRSLLRCKKTGWCFPQKSTRPYKAIAIGQLASVGTDFFPVLYSIVISARWFPTLLYAESYIEMGGGWLLGELRFSIYLYLICAATICSYKRSIVLPVYYPIALMRISDIAGFGQR